VTPALVEQLALLVAEALLVATVLLALFRLRSIFGLVPIYTTVAIFYQMANFTAATVYVKITPDVMISPGSVILFPAILVAVLYVYLREDAQEARKLIYALLAGDIVVALLGLAISEHFRSPLVFNPYALPADLLVQQPRIVVVGTLALFADTVLIIMLYELVSRRVTSSIFLRLLISLLSVLLFDTVFFVTGSFAESPAYASILISGAIGKSVAGVLYAVLLTVFLHYFDTDDQPAASGRRTLGDLFELLTYRQKYEVLKAQMTRDGLTGVYNRAFFDDTLEVLLAGSLRTNSPVTLLMADIDDFKSINDTYGHRMGDRVLQSVATTIAESARASDLVCRYGGEEFAIVLPDTDQSQGIQLARRVCRAVPESLAAKDELWKERKVTMTIGLACFPVEATTADELIQLADRRLYAGKHAGRNRVVADLTRLGDEPPREVATPRRSPDDR
jgi:diguanylate cyclase (GGDEF)-like protein